jgi:hypothetical protein
LGLACACRKVDIVIAFMNAGARDTAGDIDHLHRALIRSGDHATRRLLNASPLTTAFRRKKLNGVQNQPAKSPQGQLLRHTGDAKETAQSRQGGAARHRKGEEQEPEVSSSASASADENSSGQPEAPKEVLRRRLAATGVNSLRALLQQNAVALAQPSTPSPKMVEAQHQAKHVHVEQPAPRIRRGRGRFQGSEEAAAGDAPEVGVRHPVRESKVCATVVRCRCSCATRPAFRHVPLCIMLAYSASHIQRAGAHVF